jgi:hypothetical protein
MRRPAAPYPLPAATTVAVDPATGESKIGSSRWSIFLVDIRNEAVKFLGVLTRAGTDHRAANCEFERWKRQSFNAIHNVRRRKPADDGGVFRTRHRAPPQPGKRPQDGLFPAPRPRPPARSVPLRLLAPERLRTIFGVGPKPRDTFVVGGLKVYNRNDW